MNKLYLIILFLFLFHSFHSQWGDCSNSTDACTNPSFNVTPSGFGNIEEFTSFSTVSNPQTNPNPIPGNMGCLLSGELNSTWLLITVSTSGTLEFSMGTAGTFNCFDWIMWPYDPAQTCTEIQNNNWAPIACNWNGACLGITGMANPGNLPAGADLTDFEMGLNVNAGDQFMICFSNFSSASTNVPLNFFGTATVSCGNAFGATICYGDTATIYATSGISYTWDTSIPGFIGTNSIGDTAYVNPTTTTNYLVTIDFGPTGTQLDTALVEVLPALNSTVISQAESCLDSADGSLQITTLSGLPPIDFSITGPTTTASNQTGIFNNLEAGNYSITITDANGCLEEISAIIEDGPFCCNFSAEITTDSVRCLDDCSGEIFLTLSNAIEPISIEWYKEISISNDSLLATNVDTLSNLCTGNYYAIVVDSTLCPSTDTVEIYSNEIYPSISVMNDTTITAGLEYIVWGFGSGEITWSPSTYLSCTYCDTASSIGTETIEYIATVTDSIGCKISDTVSIEVVINPLFVPTGFSPNGDGLNDVLKVIGGGTSYFKFQIFDKWGNVVFETSDISKGWDGTYKGIDLPTDVFIYVVEASFLNNQIVKLKGDVTLFRK